MTIKYAHKDKNFKIAAVNHYLNVSLNKTETVKIFNCSRQNLINWVKQLEKTGLFSKKKNKSVSYEITKKHVSFITKIL